MRNEVARSTDGGATWTITAELTIVQGGACSNAQAGRGIFCINAGGSSFRSRSHPIMGISPTDPSHVYMVYSGGDLESAYTCGGCDRLPRRHALPPLDRRRRDLDRRRQDQHRPTEARTSITPG